MICETSEQAALRRRALAYADACLVEPRNEDSLEALRVVSTCLSDCGWKNDVTKHIVWAGVQLFLAVCDKEEIEGSEYALMHAFMDYAESMVTSMIENKDIPRCFISSVRVVLYILNFLCSDDGPYFGLTPLHNEAMMYMNTFIIGSTDNVQIVDDLGTSPVQLAVIGGKVQNVERLLAAGADLNSALAAYAECKAFHDRLGRPDLFTYPALHKFLQKASQKPPALTREERIENIFCVVDKMAEMRCKKNM